MRKAGIAMILFIVLLSAMPAAANDNDAVEVISGSDEAFDNLRKSHRNDYGGDSVTVEDILEDFIEDGEIDEGTYSASEIWDRDFELRRELPPELTYGGRMFFKYSDDQVEELEKWEKEFEINLDYGKYNGYFRFSDVNAFGNRQEPFRWDKGSIRYRDDETKLTVGSFGALFGRGLMLNMFEERFLEYDNQVDGIKLEQEFGSNDVTLLHGTRKELFQPFASKITAARWETEVDKGFNIGAHAASISYPPEGSNKENMRELEYDMYGGNIEMRSGDFRLYSEFVQIPREADEDGVTKFETDGIDGRGYYVNAGYNGDGYAVNAEYKNYFGLMQPFTSLPPLRRWQEQAQAEPDDDKGYAVEVLWNPFKDGSLFTFDYGQSNSRGIENPYTEAIMKYSGPSGSDTSYVIENQKVNFHGDKREIQQVSITQKLNDDFTFGTFFERELFKIQEFEDYTDYITQFEMAFQSKAILVFTRENSTLPGSEQDQWELWELKLNPSDDEEVYVVFGSRREGFVCSGGVCRLEPEFEGFRIDYLIRF